MLSLFYSLLYFQSDFFILPAFGKTSGGYFLFLFPIQISMLMSFALPVSLFGPGPNGREKDDLGK